MRRCSVWRAASVWRGAKGPAQTHNATNHAHVRTVGARPRADVQPGRVGRVPRRRGPGDAVRPCRRSGQEGCQAEQVACSHSQQQPHTPAPAPLMIVCSWPQCDTASPLPSPTTAAARGSFSPEHSSLPCEPDATQALRRFRTAATTWRSATPQGRAASQMRRTAQGLIVSPPQLSRRRALPHPGTTLPPPIIFLLFTPSFRAR